MTGAPRSSLAIVFAHKLHSGIIASVITFPEFKAFIGHSSNYDSLSGAVVSTFTGGCFFGAALAGW